MAWTQQKLNPTDMAVGPCAWDARLLLDPTGAAYVADHPSLIVIDQDMDDHALGALAPHLAALRSCPVMLHLNEPTFASGLTGLIQDKLQCLGLPAVDVVTLWVDDVADLKGGRLLQLLSDCRRAGSIKYIGLGHHDVRAAEWLAKNTVARIISLPYHLSNQLAAYRALDAIGEHGMAAVATIDPSAHNALALPFALGQSTRCLPVMSRPLPGEVTPLNDQELAAAWEAYCVSNPQPAPLDRNQPPDA